MTNDRERFLRFMRAMNTIDGEYAALMHGLRVKESLFVLLYACLDDAPRSQKEICDEWRMPRSTLNTAVLEEIKAGNVTLVPCGHKEKLVTLTRKGRAYAESLLRPILDAEARIARTVRGTRNRGAGSENRVLVGRKDRNSRGRGSQLS